MCCLFTLCMIGKWTWSLDSELLHSQKVWCGCEDTIYWIASEKEDICSEVLLSGIVYLPLEEYLES
jgi:hypothetical protein